MCLTTISKCAQLDDPNRNKTHPWQQCAAYYSPCRQCYSTTLGKLSPKYSWLQGKKVSHGAFIFGPLALFRHTAAHCPFPSLFLLFSVLIALLLLILLLYPCRGYLHFGKEFATHLRDISDHIKNIYSKSASAEKSNFPRPAVHVSVSCNAKLSFSFTAILMKLCIYASYCYALYLRRNEPDRNDISHN